MISRLTLKLGQSKQCGIDTKIDRLMEQNEESRTKPTHRWITDFFFTKVQRQIKGHKLVYSTNGVRKTECPYAKNK